MERLTPKFFTSNMALLQQKHPSVWKTLDHLNTEPTGEVVPAANGKPNLIVTTASGETISFHDNCNPEQEVGYFLGRVPEKSTGLAILSGMGLGYTPLAILKNRERLRHLVVFELNPEVFLQAIQYMDLSTLLKDRRLILSVGPNPELDKALAPTNRAAQLEDTHLLTHKASFTYNSEYKSLQPKIFEHVSKTNVNGATNSVFGHDFTKNRFKHFTTMHHHYLLENLRNTFKNVPAIIVAAGPSLDKNIRLLKKVENRAVIISVDSALPSLITHGISPHFLTSIDPQDATYEKISNLAPAAKDISLICSSAVTPKVPKFFPAKDVFWIFSGKSQEKWLSSLLDGKLLTKGAGTVAHLNLIAAIVMGCSPIIFVGQDLAYADNKDHAEHAILKHSQLMQNTINSPDFMWIDGIDGGKVPSNRSFFGMKKYFEQLMTDNPNVYINATEGGVCLEGANSCRLEQALDEFCQTKHDILNQYDNHISTLKNPSSPKIIDGFRSTLVQVEKIQKTIKRCNLLTKTALKNLHKLSSGKIVCQTFSKLPKPLQDNVVKIQKISAKLDMQMDIWRLIEELTMEGLRQTERSRHSVTDLKTTPGKYLEWLRQGIRLINEVNVARNQALNFLKQCINDAENCLTKEQKLLSAPEGNRLLQLAQLHLKYGNLVIAKPYLKEFIQGNADSAAGHFCLGTIHLQQADTIKAEGHFRKACQLDNGYNSRIDSFRHSLGQEYLVYAESYKSIDEATYKWFLFKGFKICSKHQGIISAIMQQADLDCDTIKEHLRDNDFDTVEKLVQVWQKELCTSHQLWECLSPDVLAHLYTYSGDLYKARSNFTEAVNSYEKALLVDKDSPQLLIKAMSCYFATQSYDKGITRLQQAVALDKNFATHWEEIGDRLVDANQFADAIVAYEKCFTSLPEKLHLLKKIGGAYLKSDQPEAAKEALSILRDMTSRQNTAPQSDKAFWETQPSNDMTSKAASLV